LRDTVSIVGHTISADLQSMMSFELQRPKHIGNVTRDVFDESIRPTKVPVVIEGAMSQWAAIESWRTPARLAELIGEDTTVYCRRIVEGSEKYKEDFFPVRFGEFLHEVYEIGTSDHYLTQALVFEPVGFLRRVIRSSYPGLLQRLFVDCGLPPFVSAEELAEGIMWMGSNEQVTPLHYDPADNLNCTILGRKRWILFPPEEAANLRINGNDGSDGMLSSLDDLIVDGAWRGGPIATAYEVTTEPGQILYVPAGYSHHVFSSREPSAAINFWFVDLNSVRLFAQYAHYQSLDRYGYERPVRRRAYSAAVFGGLLGMRLLYGLHPRLTGRPPAITVGEASYERSGGAT
jgi:hypothetical protein